MGKSSKGEMQVTEYYMSMHLGIALQLDSLQEIIVGEKLVWQGNLTASGGVNINAPSVFGGVKKEGGVGGTAYYLTGDATQVLPAGLAARLNLTPATCPAYRGLASVWFVGGPVAGGWTPIPGSNDGAGGSGGGWTPPGGNTCIAPWTKILMANETGDGPGAHVEVECLRPGDMVWTRDQDTLEWHAAEIVTICRILNHERLAVGFTDGRRLVVSPSHRLYAHDGLWEHVYDLSPGDTVWGEPNGVISSIEPLDTGTVFMLTVPGPQTYVSESLLSHNAKPHVDI